MEVVWAAIISAVVLVIIPTTSWFSRRATKEGRLTLRVERLAVVHAAMPQTPEKKTFEAHYRQAISDLNDWLDVDAKALREARRWFTVASYLVGLILLFVVAPLVPHGDTALQTLAGLGIATVIVAGSFGMGSLLERLAARKQEQSQRESALVEDVQRQERIRLGKAPEEQQPADGV